MPDASHGRKHPPSGPDTRLAAHFDTPRQQFSAGRLGMWLFVATELLMFGGLFCAYAILRGNHPEIFAFGSEFLDRRWGFLNTVVLVSSSFTMALAVRAAACGHQRQLVLFLTLTLICGADFMVVKYLEYSHKFEERLVWGTGFYEGHHAMAAAEAAPIEIAPGDAPKGRTLFGATCAACHGREAEGMAGLGPSLVANEFIANLDDAGLVAFVKAGRALDDPRNTTGLLMPPKGGNPLLSDQDLADIAAHLRGYQTGAERVEVAAGAPVQEEPAAVEVEVVVERSVIPLAASAPVGLDPRVPPVRRAGFFAGEPLAAVPMPPNAHLFFGIYFCMTGLHGIHVLVGIGVIGWLRQRALRGDFSSAYYTPVDLVGLYWHVVDIIWIFLFPLFYLI